MTSGKHALLLVGSPTGKRSTSESLGSYLLDQLKKRGMETQNAFIHKSLKSEEEREKLLSFVEVSDIIILAFPLYVDTLPAPVITTMELILKHYRSGKELKKHRLVVIVNSGLPEPNHNKIALANCQKFASEAGIEWVGGLAIGGGEAISGRSLEEIRGMARKVVRSLDLTAEALTKGESIPKEALDILTKPIVPKWLYLFIGNRGWKIKAKKHGANKRMYDTPYAK